MTLERYRLTRSLRARGVAGLTGLAAAAGVSRPHLSAALDFTPGRGSVTRRKVARFLTPAELALAGMDAAGRPVPRGTKHDMEQNSELKT